jgi:lysophospholipase L1-like esterase
MRSPLVLLAAATLVACAPRADAPRSDAPTATAGATPPVATPAGPRVERYAAIGASDTVGVGAADPRTGSWPARVAARLPAGWEYANYGVSGSLASQALRDQVPPAIAQEPTVLTLWLAVNDLNSGITPAEYERTLGGILELVIQRTRATVFVGNVPDLRAVPVYRGVDQAALAAQVAAYNAAISRAAARHPGRVVVVDLFQGSAELVGTATVAADGFHPSDAGYALIAERFVTAMRAAGVPLRD